MPYAGFPISGLQRIPGLFQDGKKTFFQDSLSNVKLQANISYLLFIYSVSQKSSPPHKTFCSIISPGEPV